jgi:uncharacterized protein YegP (UPF0339 family)
MSNRAHWRPVQTDTGYHIQLVGGNGEVVLTSEVYSDPRSCTDAVLLASDTDAVDNLKDERTQV